MKNFGLLGCNISYSFSPTLHNEIFQNIKLPYTYNIFDFSKEKISLLVNDLKKDKISGFNVTTPYKEIIISFLDEISPEALSIGAVNCVSIKNSKIIGFNTDYYGLIKTYKKMGINLKNKKVIILGSGGAAKAVLKSIIDLGGNPTIVSRNSKLKFSNFKNIPVISYDELKNQSGFLLVNATPVGTFPNIETSPVEKSIIQNFDFLLDLIYNPKETLFLKYGKELGKKIQNGFYMLVAQGVKSEEIWNNIQIDTDVIYEKLLDKVYKD